MRYNLIYLVKKIKFCFFNKRKAQFDALGKEYDKLNEIRYGAADRLKKEHDRLLEEAFFVTHVRKEHCN